MKEAIHTDRAPAAIGPYSQAVRAGGFLFTSGQIPVDPAAGDIPAGIKAQAQQSLDNIAAILAQAGLDVYKRQDRELRRALAAFKEGITLGER